MKKPLPIFIVSIFFFFFTSIIYAQSRFSHEVGASFGVASFQTDFGVSNDFASANASTFSVGLSWYLKFFGSQYSWRSGSSFFSEHFKLKTEFNYMLNSRVEHKGATNKKVRDMTGEIKMYNVGTNLEYYFLELEDYSSFYKSSGTLNPFISAGVHYSFYDPDIKVNNVSLEDNPGLINELIPKWQNDAVFLEKGNTFGVSAGAGIRYSIDTFDLVLDGRYQYFFSDQVDGLDAPVDPANKNNDTVIFVNVGVVFVFGKY